MKKNLKLLLFFYLPVFMWMGIIFWLSSFHNIRTGTDLIFKEIIFRKLAHAGEFFVLSWLFFRIFNKGYGLEIKKSFWLSLLFVFVYAFSDEIHQIFIAGREGRLVDVFFDILGGYLGLYLIIKNRKKINSQVTFWIILLLFFLLLFYKAWESVEIYGKYFSGKQSIEVPQKIQKTNNNQENNKDFNVIKNTKKNIEENKIPEIFLIQNVPFTSQSPYAKWDDVHEESCEEASLVMLEYFKKGKELNKKIANKEIFKLVNFQKKRFGDYKDTNAQETALLAREFYGLDFEVIYDFSQEDIKKYLSLKKPIIVPVAGRELGNPFFTPPGPLYHNLVLIGYEGDKIVVNDPGTKRGQNYVYDTDILYSAIHDFPGKKENILKGRKAMLVLK
jgi:hypothetical protein